MRAVHGRKRSDAGFTLNELMLVVLILGILVAIAVASFAQATGSARSAACLSNQRIILSVLEEYYMDEGGYPAELEDIDDLVQSSDAYRECPSDQEAYDYNEGGEFQLTCPNHPR